MKKNLKLLGLIAALAIGLTACGGGDKKTETEKPADNAATEQGAAAGAMEGPIVVVSREDGSGTRGAFTEITGVAEGDVDNTVATALIQNSTDGVMTTVAGDNLAIGYVSMSSLNDTVKAIKIDGGDPTPEGVNAGSYPLARPFNIAYKEDGLSDLGKDFIAFMMSDEGQKVVTDKGDIAVESTGAYTPANTSGTLVVGGSTSVAPLMEKMAEAYKALNPNADIQIQATGSGAGMTGAQDGTLEIGMASRELKDEEKAALQHQAIAKDGIAVIVHPSNSTEDMTMEQVKKIFLGEVLNWEEL